MIDFHMHSTASDGVHSPSDLMKIAADKGADYVALTDHNNINGLEEASVAAQKYNINFINGIEISCECNTHIVGLFLRRFDEIKEKSVLRGQYSQISLRNYGFDVGNYASLREARDAFVKMMIDTGRALSKTFAIEHFLLPPFGYGEAIDLIHRSGGLAILAHPNRIFGVDKDSLPDFIKNLVHYGIDGMEVYQSGQTDEYTDFVKDLAIKNNLLIGGGSDYHGLAHHEREIGMYGNLGNRKIIPGEVLENLLSHKDKYK